MEDLPLTLHEVLEEIRPDLRDAPDGFDVAFHSECSKSYVVREDGSGVNPLLRYVMRHVVQSNYLPQKHLKCCACDGPVTRLDIPDKLLAPTKQLPRTTPDPKLFECTSCSHQMTTTEILNEWFYSVLQDDVQPTPDDYTFSPTDGADSTDVGPIDGIPEPEWMLKLSEEDMVHLAMRANTWQGHSPAHTATCFKYKGNRGKGGCTCRFGFPAQTTAAKIVVEWTPGGAAKPVADRTVHDIVTVEFVSERADSAPYINRHEPAYLMAGNFNSDSSVCASSPGKHCIACALALVVCAQLVHTLITMLALTLSGLAYYLCGYASKSADDTPSKVGYNAMNGFLRALKSAQALRAREAEAAGCQVSDLPNQSVDARIQQAKQRVGAALSDSTKHLCVMAPLAVWGLLHADEDGRGPGGRFLFSHKFAICPLDDAVAWVSGTGLSTRMVRVHDGDEIRYTAVSDVMGYAYRGAALAELSLYEVCANYSVEELPQNSTVTVGAAAAVARCPRTGRPLELLLHPAVAFTKDHPLVHSHHLKRRSKPVVPHVFTPRLRGETDLLGAEDTDTVASDHKLRYLALHSPWFGTEDEPSTLSSEPSEIAAAFEQFTSPDSNRTLFARRLMRHDENEALTRKVSKRLRQRRGGGRSYGDLLFDPVDASNLEIDLHHDPSSALHAPPLTDAVAAFLSATGDGTADTVHAGSVAATFCSPFDPASPATCPYCGVVATVGNTGVICSNPACLNHGCQIPDLRTEMLMSADGEQAPFSTLADDPIRTGSVGSTTGTPSISLLATDLRNSWDALPRDTDPLTVPRARLLMHCSANPDNATLSADCKPLNGLQHTAYLLLCGGLLRGLALESGAAPGAAELLSAVTALSNVTNGPLRCAILGEGGVGKSHVLHAFRRFADALGLGDRIAWTGSTGACASLIGGSTFHKTFKVPCIEEDPDTVDDADTRECAASGDARPKRQSRKQLDMMSPELAMKWVVVSDEISMLPSRVLATGSLNAARMRCQQTLRQGAAAAAFDGMSFFLLGDMQQLPPAGNDRLFAGKSSGNSAKGRQIWRDLNCAAILTETKRCTDPELNKVLTALRTGTFDRTAQTLLESRCYSSAADIPLDGAVTAVLRSNQDVNSVNATVPSLRAAAAGLPVVRLPCILRTRGDSQPTTGMAYDYMASIDASGFVAHGGDDALAKGLVRNLDVSPDCELFVRMGNRLVDECGVGQNTKVRLTGFADPDGCIVNPVVPAWRQHVTLPDGSETVMYVPPVNAIGFILVTVVRPFKPFRYLGLPANTVALPRSLRHAKHPALSFAQFAVRHTLAQVCRRCFSCLRKIVSMHHE